MTAESPATGATDADIEAAKRRRWNRIGHFRERLSWEHVNPQMRLRMYGDIDSAADDLVPPGHVIALAEHVTDDADREAIGRAVEIVRMAVESVEDYEGIGVQFACTPVEFLDELRKHVTPDLLARMERLSGSGNR